MTQPAAPRGGEPSPFLAPHPALRVALGRSILRNELDWTVGTVPDHMIDGYEDCRAQYGKLMTEYAAERRALLDSIGASETQRAQEGYFDTWRLQPMPEDTQQLPQDSGQPPENHKPLVIHRLMVGNKNGGFAKIGDNGVSMQLASYVAVRNGKSTERKDAWHLGGHLNDYIIYPVDRYVYYTWGAHQPNAIEPTPFGDVASQIRKELADQARDTVADRWVADYVAASSLDTPAETWDLQVPGGPREARKAATAELLGRTKIYDDIRWHGVEALMDVLFGDTAHPGKILRAGFASSHTPDVVRALLTIPQEALTTWLEKYGATHKYAWLTRNLPRIQAEIKEEVVRTTAFGFKKLFEERFPKEERVVRSLRDVTKMVIDTQDVTLCRPPEVKLPSSAKLIT